MKFLCPSCKAKYQIADEKVVGRSVRMKCRKCGFVIPLSEIPPAPATVPPDESTATMPVVPRSPGAPTIVVNTIPPVSLPPGPPAPAPSPTTSGAGLPPSPAPGRVGEPTAPSRVGPPARPVAPDAFRRPTLSDVKPGAPKPAAPSSPLAAKVAPKPGAPGAPRAPATGPGTATKAPVPKPAATAARGAAAVAAAAPAVTPAPPVAAPVPGPAPAASTNLLSALDEDDGVDDDATHILKGGALAHAFGALVGDSPAGANEIGMPADEWFVGINDVPVGPIRLGEIRKRAMLGAITPESMVWRDGLEAWRPLKTFPELVAVLEESMSSVRASAAPLMSPAAGAPPRKGDSDSFASATSAGGITGPAVVTDDYAAAGLARPRTSVFAWLAVVVAAAFGLTIGFVMFSKQKPPETVIKYIEVPAKGQVTAAVATGDSQTTEAAAAASGVAAKARAAGSKANGSKSVDAPAADKGGGLSGLKGLSGLSPSGPGVSGANPASAPAGGGQLDAAQTQSTVARYTGSVKRSCWQPALDARDPNAPTSARVMLTITVGPTGSVQNVTTSGEPRGYPGLGSCIAGRVRAWQFPASGGTTTVNVPFVFAAQ
jgi:predicted Zn finger-like uncharacterized protein